MAVTRKKVDTQIERQILTGMIVSDAYLRDVIPIYQADLLEITFAPIIAGWCIDYFRKYEKAPGRDVQELFNRWAKSDPPPDVEQKKFVETFLGTLSEEYEHAEKFNVPYLLDKTVAHFGLRAFDNLAEDLKWAVGKGDLEAAQEIHGDFKKVERIQATAVNPYLDEDAIRRAFEAKAAPLFTLPGKIGEVMNEQLTRESFIDIMGLAKVGKTWFLKWLAEQAHRCRCNVAYFQMGDLSESDFVLRTHITLAQRSNKKKYCGELMIPVLDCELNQKDTCENYKKRLGTIGCYENNEILSPRDAVGYTPCSACKDDYKSPFKGALWHEIKPPVDPLTWQEAVINGKAYVQRMKAKGFYLETYQNDSCTMSMVDRQLQQWEDDDGFVADVVVVDYMDIVAAEAVPGDERFHANLKWKKGRALSQKRKCCLITGSQADSMAIGQDSLTRKNFTIDRRKWDHITAGYALNQTPEEKRIGKMRLGQILVREGEFDEIHQVKFAQCLAIGKAYLFSY